MKLIEIVNDWFPIELFAEWSAQSDFLLLSSGFRFDLWLQRRSQQVDPAAGGEAWRPAATSQRHLQTDRRTEGRAERQTASARLREHHR